MSNLSLSGTLTRVSNRIKKSEKFTMRLFVIQTDGRYPQPVKFQLTNDRCDIIDNFKEGDYLTVHFDIQGNEWEGKIINNLNAWKIEKPGGYTSQPQPEFEPKKLGDQDDLPF